MKRRREMRPPTDQDRTRAEGIVKRLNRRMMEGRNLPFILVCFEPARDDIGRPVMKAESLAFGMRTDAGAILQKIAKEYLAKIDEVDKKEAGDGEKKQGE